MALSPGGGGVWKILYENCAVEITCNPVHAEAAPEGACFTTTLRSIKIQMNVSAGFVAHLNAQSAFQVALLKMLVQKGLLENRDAFALLTVAGNAIAEAGDSMANDEAPTALSNWLAEDFQRQAAHF
jgi:hypothetical protein